MDRVTGTELYVRLWRVFAHHKAQRLEQVAGGRARIDTRLLRIRFAIA